MVNTPSPIDADLAPSATPEHGPDPVSMRTDLWLFVGMLALALGGVAVTQLEHTGGKLYWVFLVLVYGLVSVGRTWARQRRHGHPTWAMVRAQVFHWLGTLVAVNIVLMFEAQDITNRGAASDFSVLVLALSCYLAGVHFSWPFLLLGGVLAVIAVGLGFLDQLSVFALALPVAVLAVWMVVRRSVAAKL